MPLMTGENGLTVPCYIYELITTKVYRRLNAILFYLHIWGILSVIYRWNRNQKLYLQVPPDVDISVWILCY